MGSVAHKLCSPGTRMRPGATTDSSAKTGRGDESRKRPAGPLPPGKHPPARHRPGARVRSAGTEVSLIASEAQLVRSRLVERVFFLEREDNMSELRKFIDAVNAGEVQLGKAVAVALG